MKKLIYLITAVVFFVSNVSAQDPAFTNNNQALVVLNPSFAGSNGGVRNQLSYRRYSLGYFEQYANTFDIYLKSLKGGLALTLAGQRTLHGLFSHHAANLTYAQHISFNKFKITPSVQLGFGQNKYDPSKSDWLSNDVLGRKNYLDVSSGMLLNYKENFYIGFVWFHINRPDVGINGPSRIYSRLVFHTSYTFLLSNENRLQLFYCSNSTSAFANHQTNANFLLKAKFVLGLGYNWSFKEPVFIVGYRANLWSFQLGYDFTASRLAGNRYGSYELHASFNLRDAEKKTTVTNFETW